MTIQEDSLPYMKNMKEKIKVDFNRKSPFTQELKTMALEIIPKDYYDWGNGKLIQDAFPYLTPDQREFIKTGITLGEWENAFKEENDVDEA